LRIRQIVGIGAVSVCVLIGAAVNAQVKKGKTRPLQTAWLMKGVVKPNCDALKKGLDAKPANDEGWQALAMNAALLNEVSYQLMDDGRCPDGTWADAASKTLRPGSADLLAAIEKKDLDGAKAAFGSMTKSCKGCHDAHKSKK
jgi:cytochrome c556